MNPDFKVVICSNARCHCKEQQHHLLADVRSLSLRGPIPKEKLAQSFLQFFTPLPILNIRQSSDRRVEDAINFAVG
jgi:hypothetical protein